MTEQKLTLINDDCLNTLKGLADNSVDLILTDPPYFQVKKDAWDNQWSSVDEFLAWLDSISAEMWRVLKPSGTLYMFCGSKLAAETELLLKQRFEVLNHIIWTKPSVPWNKANKESLRSFFPATERIIMCGHYGAEGFAKGSSDYYGKCQNLKQQVFSPLIEYFKQAKDKLKVPAKAINQATGTRMASHWFSYSQWKLPTESQYLALQRLFNSYENNGLNTSYDDLKGQFDNLQEDYQVLVRQYDDLKEEYSRLRRPFSVTKDVPFTDVWSFKSVQYYPGKHPCEKPAPLLEHIIKTSSREGDVVLDCFMGSGSTGKVSLPLNRKFIGIEMDKDIFNCTLESFESL